MNVSDRDIEKFYQTLELPINSSQAEVKAAYRSLARQHHPDRVIGDPAKHKESEEYFKRINAAHDFLKTYDPPTQKGKNTTSKFNVEVQTARNPADRTPAAFVREAQYFQSIGKLQDALMALDTAIALEDDYYPAYDLRSEVRFALGNAYGSGMDLKRAKHFRWVYQSEGRSIDSPTKSQSSSSSGTAARDAAKAAVDSGFKTQNRSKSSSEPSKQPQSSPPPKKPTPDKSSSASKSPTATPPPTPVHPQPELRQIFTGHVDIISQILFANRSLIGASLDGNVFIWSLELGKLEACLKVGAGVTAIAVSPTANLLITGDRRGQVKMWNLQQQKLIRSLPLHTNAVTGIHISPNGNGFTTTGEDGVVKMFQLQPASLLYSLQFPNFPIYSSGILDDRIFTTSADSKLRLITNGAIRREELLSSPLCKSMAVNPARKWIAIGDDRGSVHCFDINGNLLKSFAAFSQGAIQAMSFVTSKDKLIVAGEKGAIKVWDIKNWDLVTEWNNSEHPVSTIAVHDDGKIAIADKQTIRLWHLP
jgi:curved DNA-binding protein CbpA